MPFASEDFVACARYGELEEMKAMIQEACKDEKEQDANKTRRLLTFVDKESYTRNTALHVAAANNHLDILDYILPHLTPVDVNLMNVDGNTALHMAALMGHEQAVEKLLGFGGDATIRNLSGRSPSTLAEQQGHMSVATLLLKSFDPEEEEEDEEDQAER